MKQFRGRLGIAGAALFFVMPHPARPALRIIAVCSAAAILPVWFGCATAMPEPRPPRPPVQAEMPLPTYDEVAQRYNERIVNLPRLWARTTGRIWFPDEDGRTQTEQVEGHLQFMAPDRLLLNFDKVGQTYGLMGTNAARYWWIELDRDRRAYVGEHNRVTAERIAELGMPIYPPDVIDLLGITSIPAPGETARSTVAWSSDRRMLVVMTAIASESQPGAAVPISAYRRLFLDPTTYEPLRVEILGADEQIRAVSELGNYQAVTIPGAGPEVPRPRVAGEIYVGTADETTTMRLRMLSPPEISRRRPNEASFEFDNLIVHYRVGEVISLDEPRAAAR
jgi:hypothetical protein